MKRSPFGPVDEFVTSFSVKIPWSYYGILKSHLEERKVILDVGCGDGGFMYVFNKYGKLTLYGVDIFEDDLNKAKRLGIYKKLFKKDVTKLNLPAKSFDIVIASHVIEHLNKNQGLGFLNKLEKLAREKVIVVTPLGFREQGAHSGNVFQKHKSGWYPKDFEKRGYEVTGQGLSIYYTNKPLNYFLRFLGPLNNIFFIFHILAQPIIAKRFIKYAHQLICVKKIV